MTSFRRFIRRTALVALVLSLAGLAFVWAVAERSTRVLYASSGWVEHTYLVLTALSGIRESLTAAEAAARGYVLTGDPADAVAVRGCTRRVAEHLDAIASLTADNPRQQDRVSRLRAVTVKRLHQLEAAVAAGWTRPAGGRAELPAVLHDDQADRTVLGEMEAEERALLADRSASNDANYRLSTAASLTAAAFAAAVLIGAYLLVRRDLAARQREEERAREAERFTRLILDSTNDGVYGIDRDGVCTYVNASAARLLGYEPADLVGRRVHDLIHHSRADRTARGADECDILKAAREGKKFRTEDVLWRTDGTPLPVDHAVVPLMDDGMVRGAVVTFADLSARRRAEAEAREQREHFRTMANFLPQLAWIAEADGAITWYNRRWYDYTGTTADQMQGWGWKTVHHPEHVDRVVASLSHAFATGQEWEDTFPLRSAGGEYRWFLSRAMPIRDAAGAVVRWFGTNTDVEDRRRAEREAAEAKDAAEAANQAKSTFLANMSHELRTPLNAVILYSELLQEEAEDRGIDDFLPDLEKIRAAGRHLLDLVNSILDLSKIEAGKMDLFVEPRGGRKDAGRPERARRARGRAGRAGR